MLAVAAVLLSWHEGTGRNTWRNPTSEDRLMMSTLIAWGYQASEIEQAIAKGKTPTV